MSNDSFHFKDFEHRLTTNGSLSYRNLSSDFFPFPSDRNGMRRSRSRFSLESRTGSSSPQLSTSRSDSFLFDSRNQSLSLNRLSDDNIDKGISSDQISITINSVRSSSPFPWLEDRKCRTNARRSMSNQMFQNLLLTALPITQVLHDVLNNGYKRLLSIFASIYLKIR